MRNLCDDCIKCEDNSKSLSYCFDVCSIGCDLLNYIEKIRNYNSTLNPDQTAGYYTAIREICDLRNGCEWPEDLEIAIDDFLEERGMKE